VIVTTTYQRKTFRVQAIRVTEENMKELADWCGGQFKIETSGPHGGLGDPYIQVAIGRVQGRPQHASAYVGDWVTRLSAGNNFRVYKSKSFLEAFQEIANHEEKYAEVHQVIVNAMNQQDKATWGGVGTSAEMDLVADKATRAILGLF